MTNNSNAKISPPENSGVLHWFLSLRPIWKLSFVELAVYLAIGMVGLIKLLANS
jgi:hypothetical protein